MDDKNSILGKARKFRKKADDDDSSVSPELKTLLRKIVSGAMISKMSPGEARMLEDASKRSPKFRMMLRMAKHRYIRVKMAEYQRGEAQKDPERVEVKTGGAISEIKDGLVSWVSDLWTPKFAGELVTAADVVEDGHVYRMEEGEIRISCYWEDKYEDDPAFIRIKWEADVAYLGLLRIRFIDPETGEVLHEDRLGEDMKGEEVFTSKDIGFDPFVQRWSVSIIMCEPDE